MMKKFVFYMIAAALLVIAGCERGNCIVEDDIDVNDENIAVTDIHLDLTSIMLKEGDTRILDFATILPGDATIQEVIWTSSHPEIAYVRTDGVLEARNTGECVIIATTKDGNLKATCNVSVITISGIVDLKIGEVTEFKIGEIACDAQHDLSLRIETINDRRCPVGLVCIDGGNVYVQFLLTTQSGEHKFTLSDIHQHQQNPVFKRDTIIEGLKYQLADVLPYPNISEQQIKTVKISVTNENEDTLIIAGKWKLDFVGYMDSNISPAIRDYSQYDIIYDFMENNVLIVSGNVNKIDDYRGHAIGTHSYELLPLPLFEAPAEACFWGRQIKIGAETHLISFGWVFFDSYEGSAMHISIRDGTLILVRQ